MTGVSIERRREQYIRFRPPTRTEGIALCDELERTRAERDALAAALADIAGGECWQTRCPDGDLCDVCTARKALGMLP